MPWIACTVDPGHINALEGYILAIGEVDLSSSAYTRYNKDLGRKYGRPLGVQGDLSLFEHIDANSRFLGHTLSAIRESLGIPDLRLWYWADAAENLPAPEPAQIGVPPPVEPVVVPHQPLALRESHYLACNPIDLANPFTRMVGSIIVEMGDLVCRGIVRTRSAAWRPTDRLLKEGPTNMNIGPFLMGHSSYIYCSGWTGRSFRYIATEILTTADQIRVDRPDSLCLLRLTNPFAPLLSYRPGAQAGAVLSGTLLRRSRATSPGNQRFSIPLPLP